MAYIVYKNTNTVLTTIEVGEVDNATTDLYLIGKNVNNYGEYINNNFVKLLTHFAGTTPPIGSQEGQVWYDSSEKRLKLFNGSQFTAVVGATVGSTATLVAPDSGDLLFDVTTDQLKVWQDNQYKVIGPAVSSEFKKFGIEPPPFTIYDYNSGAEVDAGIIHSYGSYIGVLTTNSFTMEASTASVLMSRSEPVSITNGLTIFNELDVKGTIRLNGADIFSLPVTYLTSFYNITRFGTIQTDSTITNFNRYNSANQIIASNLTKVYSTSTTPVSSEVKVVCDFDYMVTATSVTQTADTGTTTIYVNQIDNIMEGNIVLGSISLPMGTMVTSIGTDTVEVSYPIIDAIVTGTTLTFNSVETSIRHFKLYNYSGTNRWAPNEIYSTATTANLGNTATSNIVVI